MEKNELKSQDDLNQPETHSTEVLLSTIEELKRTKKQLEIAVDALEELTNSDNWSVEQVDGENVFCFNMKYPWRFTGKALKKIKELEK